MPEQAEVVQTDPLGRRDAIPASKRVEQDARERIRDEDGNEADRGCCIGEAPQPLWAAGPPSNRGCLRRDQGFSVLRPLSTFCIACSGGVFPENAAWSCW